MFLDMITPRWVGCAVVVAALTAGACGSGAVDGPEDDTEAADGQADGGGGNGDGGGGEDGGFSWNLPVGDISPDDSTELYYSLRRDCDADGKTEAARGRYPDELIKLYEAAVAICRGDVERGRALYAEGAGDGGYSTGCLVREAVLSVLDQRPQDISACPYSKVDEEELPSEEETPTGEGEPTTTSTEGGGTTTTSSAGGLVDPPVESGGEGDDGA